MNPNQTKLQVPSLIKVCGTDGAPFRPFLGASKEAPFSHTILPVPVLEGHQGRGAGGKGCVSQSQG